MAKNKKTKRVSKRAPYEYEKIMDRRQNEHGDWEYLVRWKGCDHDQDTWEPRESFVNTQLIDAFDRANDGGKGKDPERWIVERIVNRRQTANGAYQYMVKWKDYDNYSNTWEPRESFANRTICDDYDRQLVEYQAQQKAVQESMKNRESPALSRNASKIDKLKAGSESQIGTERPSLGTKRDAPTEPNTLPPLAAKGLRDVPDTRTMLSEVGMVAVVTEQDFSLQGLRPEKSAITTATVDRVESKPSPVKESDSDVETIDLQSERTSNTTGSSRGGTEFSGSKEVVKKVEADTSSGGPTFRVQCGAKVANIRGLMNVNGETGDQRGKKRLYEALVEYSDGSHEIVPTSVLKKCAPEQLIDFYESGQNFLEELVCKPN